MDIVPPKSVALVIGVTGMTGTSLVQALKSPTAPGSPWTVHSAARRPPPSRFPFSDLDTFVQLDALDRYSTIRTLSPLATHVTHLFWVAAVASRDTEEENIAANCAMLANALHALTSVTGYSLRHVALQTGTQYYFGSFLNSDQENLPVPFRENSPRLPYPVFYYALEDLLATYSHKLTWTVHRSSFIFGASTISIYNLLLTLFIYALICRREGSQFMYPGNQYTWRSCCCDATDSDLLADQQIWAATTTHDTKYQVFNCANGGIFTWRSFWEVTSNIFHLEYVECPQNELGPNWIDTMMTKGPVWDAIVQENGLEKTRLEEQISSFKAVYAVLNFRCHHVCNINKSQEYGFRRYMHTLKSVSKWVDKLKNLNVIPKD